LVGSFAKKIMSVDMLPNGALGREDFSIFAKNGWEVYFGEGGGRSGMVNNQLRGIKHATAEWLLLCEDDAPLLLFPDISTLEEGEINWLCYNCHLNDEDLLNDYVQDRGSYLVSNGGVFMIKPVNLCDKWLLTFPASITKKSVILALHEVAARIAIGTSIEEGLSVAWRAGSFGNVAIYLNREVLDNLHRITTSDLHKFANMRYWNNDESTRHGSVDKSCMWY